jgi:hypothetical protein
MIARGLLVSLLLAAGGAVAQSIPDAPKEW